MIWGISCLQFCKKSADHKEGNTCSEVPKYFVENKFSTLVCIKCLSKLQVKMIKVYLSLKFGLAYSTLSKFD